MFTYPCQGETRGSKKVITNQEFFIRLGQRLIKVLDCQSADGFVFGLICDCGLMVPAEPWP